MGPAQWRGAGCLAGGSIIGPSPFCFFLGQCQKEQTPLTQHQPIPILSPPFTTNPSHYHPACKLIYKKYHNPNRTDYKIPGLMAFVIQSGGQAETSSAA
ncbi:MAG: hypothetical protein AVDCRST_MAG56-2444 [uncultured Cytophagales bacterium]|uniref:Uncharacterized protein n=1 Tax=uncultured Cytophagales bacterium TaxID=158755 RepID=A0A6J4IT56_9SPHI|nr:MAG: hypothetical protein AVDCRST_MAG56-2444 [uncultured Cytophagales bacterium]